MFSCCALFSSGWGEMFENKWINETQKEIDKVTTESYLAVVFREFNAL